MKRCIDTVFPATVFLLALFGSSAAAAQPGNLLVIAARHEHSLL